MKQKATPLEDLKEAFKEDYRVALSTKQAKEAARNLVDFFSLLYDWDIKDKQKEIEMKGFKNESKKF